MSLGRTFALSRSESPGPLSPCSTTLSMICCSLLPTCYIIPCMLLNSFVPHVGPNSSLLFAFLLPSRRDFLALSPLLMLSRPPIASNHFLLRCDSFLEVSAAFYTNSRHHIFYITCVQLPGLKSQNTPNVLFRGGNYIDHFNAPQYRLQSAVRLFDHELLI